MNIDKEIQNILDRNFTRGDNAKAKQELLVLFGVSNRRELLTTFRTWWWGNREKATDITNNDLDRYFGG